MTFGGGEKPVGRNAEAVVVNTKTVIPDLIRDPPSLRSGAKKGDSGLAGLMLEATNGGQSLGPPGPSIQSVRRTARPHDGSDQFDLARLCLADLGIQHPPVA